jgi:hypothetical protein
LQGQRLILKINRDIVPMHTRKIGDQPVGVISLDTFNLGFCLSIKARQTLTGKGGCVIVGPRPLGYQYDLTGFIRD